MMRFAYVMLFPFVSFCGCVTISFIDAIIHSLHFAWFHSILPNNVNLFHSLVYLLIRSYQSGVVSFMSVYFKSLCFLLCHVTSFQFISALSIQFHLVQFLHCIRSLISLITTCILFIHSVIHSCIHSFINSCIHSIHLV